jgi:hypothetical protein
MTIVELLVALLILAVGILATFALFESSKRAMHVSEVLEGQNHIAQRELERIESLGYSNAALTGTSSSWSATQDSYTYVSRPGGGCPGAPGGPAPTYQPDRGTGGSTASEPLVIDGCTGPDGKPISGGVIAPVDTTTYPGYTVYDFITWHDDATCGTTQQGVCPTIASYKRATVVVTANQVPRLTPTSPVLDSTVIADPKAAPNVRLNISTPLVTCDPIVPASTPCNYGLNGQTANAFYLTDSPEQSAIATTGTWSGTSTSPTRTITLGNASGIEVGMYVGGPGIPSGTTVTAAPTSPSQITVSADLSTSAANVALAIGPFAGVHGSAGDANVYTGTANATTTITGVSMNGAPTTAGIQGPSDGRLGMYVIGTGTHATYIPSGTYVTAVDAATDSITLSQAATASGSVTLMIGPYQPRSADDSCMHYTAQARPLEADGTLDCGGSLSGHLACSATASASATPIACAQPDLLYPAAAPPGISEYNFSPQPGTISPPGGQGRVIKRDPSATGSTPAQACAVTPTNDATMSEFWATQPLAQSLNLTGFGGMTLYTRTLSGSPQNVTLCVALYLETPASTPVGWLIDPLGQLCGSCSTRLGTVVAYANPQWPGTMSPVAFTFNYMQLSDSSAACSGVTSATRCAPAGSSLGVRVWTANTSADDIVIDYDSASTPSDVDIDSQ